MTDTTANPQFGALEETRVLDSNGSTVKTSTNIRDGKPSFPMRVTSSERVRVRNKKEQDEEYIKWSDDIASHDDYLDPEFKLDRPKSAVEKGFWYVVKSFTRLVHE